MTDRRRPDGRCASVPRAAGKADATDNFGNPEGIAFDGNGLVVVAGVHRIIRTDFPGSVASWKTLTRNAGGITQFTQEPGGDHFTSARAVVWGP